METQTLIELLMTVATVIFFGFVAWCTRALSTGQLGLDSRIGIRTQAVKHCEKCWLLGHHAAAAKINIALVLGVGITVVPAVLGFLLQMPTALIMASRILGLAVVALGVVLGARDAAWVTSKIHVSTPGAGAEQAP